MGLLDFILLLIQGVGYYCRMRYSYLEQVLSKRSRILIHALIISGTLNLALIATFVTLVIKERKRVVVPVAQVSERVKEVQLKNEEVLREFASMTYDTLVRELYDETHVEEGQRRCDLALAALTRYHDFDVKRAFVGFPVEQRKVVFGEESMVLFSGMRAERLEGVRLFARREVWPLTPRGLFNQIQNREEIPESLRESFILTNEFFEIKRAIGRLPYAISDETLFNLVTAGDWESVETFSSKDLVSFLVPRMEKGSKLAAYLMVLEERDYALKSLDDGQMEKLLALLTEKTPAIESFLKEVGDGIRADHVKELAGKPLENPPRQYTVQAGDSLWKISRMFDVKVEIIQEMNGLDSESLKPDIELTLPADTAPSPLHSE
ncbi:LysM peptidoglycan-binding domain-containing protein [Candidatus Neptunichlamydia sp. REUL1]|uniref:LysM peptidoglycan-binding domain-containing protein n=1 Tax=Candidatus Neptunichlamydia sp. REUL1 TaxID=3064277 RepID=UPI00292F5D3D|nr:LysM peptidoglycan-binding domain-containing protein [Candidatus Neptunochlamydia sp. REUL1]